MRTKRGVCQNRWAIPVLIVVCVVGLPAQGKYSGGIGEPNDPYQIATAADLIALGQTPEDYDRHFVLTADLDLDPNLPDRVFREALIAPNTSRTLSNFQDAPFIGVLDGKGHTISHLTIQGVSYLGLFGQIESDTGAEVKNLGVLDVNISGSGSYVGGLVGSNGDPGADEARGSVCLLAPTQRSGSAADGGWLLWTRWSGGRIKSEPRSPPA